MKTAILYYSLTGNAEYAARRMAEKLGADLIPLTPEKAYPDSGFRKFYYGGKSAVMGEAPALTPYIFDPRDYDCVILGTPVWAGTMAPPLRTAIREHRAALQGKRVAAFVCSGGGGAEKALERIRAEVGVSAFAGKLSLIDPKARPNADNERKIADFCDKLLQ